MALRLHPAQPAAPSPPVGAATSHDVDPRPHEPGGNGEASERQTAPRNNPRRRDSSRWLPIQSIRASRGNRFRVHALADGSWRIGFITRLGHRDFPADPATDAAFAEFYRMTTADQIDAAAGDMMARGPITRTRMLLPATV